MTTLEEEFKLQEYPLTQRQVSSSGTYRGHQQSHVGTLKGPLRVLRFCLLGILLPCMLAVFVLYLRYRVFIEQLYPLAVSDMRMLDNRISTTWCQKQRVKVNNATTFNAYLMSEPPTLEKRDVPVSMVRHMLLEDDTKEYWGFYLLKGSVVTLSTCVRYPGASLIVIRGHKHLHECAYIGDNSSEEIDELMQQIEEGTFTNTPDIMKRHRDGVEFHHPDHMNVSNVLHTLKDGLDTSDITDSKLLREILAQLSEKSGGSSRKNNPPQPGGHMHVHRNSTIAKGESVNITSQTVNNTYVLNDVRSSTQNSEEIINDVMHKLGQMGVRGRSILERLNSQMAARDLEHQAKDINHLQHLPPADSHINTGRRYEKPAVHFDDNIDKGRRRRSISISSAVERILNGNDNEDENTAIEEGFEMQKDGIADHHAVINETTANDMSNSEFWSSFSSSEEALLNCAGLILNLPLTPHTQCKDHLTEDEISAAYKANTITYNVPTNGYYFFVFNSENERQKNYIRVRFHIDKTVYNVSSPVAQCRNSTQPCALDLRFFSNDVLVMELPVVEDVDLWNSEFVVVSECEPRTTLYAMLVIAVPVLVILFAFQ